jgi:hypothetical protein
MRCQTGEYGLGRRNFFHQDNLTGEVTLKTSSGRVRAFRFTASPAA